MIEMMNVDFLKENGVDVDKSLELFGDIETYNDTIGEFILGANSKLPKLEEYKNQKDMNNYATYAHSLKSDAKYFGFTKLAELAENQEMKSKAGDVYYIYDTYDELVEEVKRLIHLIKKYLGTEEAFLDKRNYLAGYANAVYNSIIPWEGGKLAWQRRNIS